MSQCRPEPITATHMSFKTGEFLRPSGGIYAQVYLDGYWVECSLLRNTDLKQTNDFIGGKALRLSKVGLRKMLCNLRLKLIGSDYRV